VLYKNNNLLLQKNNEIRAVLGGFPLVGDARGASYVKKPPKTWFKGSVGGLMAVKTGYLGIISALKLDGTTIV
jgi:hypothetical protein